MLIASWPLQDFAGFLQIISWITLPVLFLAVLITMIIHYYQRVRRRRMEKLLENEGLASGTGNASHQIRYRTLKNDFVALQQLYRASEEELTSLNEEMKRQDYVIDQLRSEVVSLEKHLLNLRLALQLKEEQLNSVTQLLEERSKTGVTPEVQ